MITPDGTLRGVDAIRGAFTELFTGLFKPGTYEFSMDSLQVEGEVAYIAWHADAPTASVPLGTDTFLVRDDKIVVQTLTAKIDPK